MLIESGASIFTRDKQGKNALGYALEVNERTIQDEQVFDVVLSGMLKEESEENALKQMHSLLRKYQKLHLKKSITCLLNRIPTLKARKGVKINHMSLKLLTIIAKHIQGHRDTFRTLECPK